MAAEQALDRQDESGSPAETVIFQGGAGGQIFERTNKGEELKWADVVAYDPPHRFVLAGPSREQDGPKTEVEVTFTDEGGKTRVELEHRGWEALGEEAAEARQSYARAGSRSSPASPNAPAAKSAKNSASASTGAPTCWRPSFVTTRPRGVRCRKPSWSR